MYDYYEMIRQQQLTNTNLQTIHNDLTTINTNQATLNNSIKEMGILITMIISVILIYKFIERCFR